MQLNLIAKYNIAKDGLIISPSSFISEYLHGIKLVDDDGREYSINDIRKKIIEATTVISNYLKIKIVEQEVNEEQDYIHTEWMNWGHIKLEFKPNQILEVAGYINSQKVTLFPKEMWVMKGRNIALIPGAHNLSSSIWFNNAGAYPVLQSGVSMVPNFWHIKYKTGFVSIPLDIIMVICKYVAIQVLSILGNIVLGSGITSESISFDGLSQSVSTGNGFENRIKRYADELLMDLPRLKSNYRGLIFETL